MSNKPFGTEAETEWRIVGLGTCLGSDDAIGLFLVQALSKEAEWTPHCRLLEGADAATIAASLLEWRRKVILVDAADMNLPPGEHRFFSDKDAAMILKTDSVSTHGLGLAEGLELARILGFDLPVFIFGIQPFDLTPGRELTPEMNAQFPSLLSALKAECSGRIDRATPAD